MSPVFGVIILGVFLYWSWIYRDIIIDTFRKVEIAQLMGFVVLMLFSSILTVFALVILIRDKGYSFGFADGYHSLNLSQLASMIPGGVWGYAGFAAYLWSKGISKVDSVVIIFLNTLIMLSACAVVGISGLMTILGWEYAVLCLFPFLFLIFGRNWLDKIRQRYYPESSRLPSTTALLKALFLGVVVWLIISSSFAWLLYTGNGRGVIPFWTVIGAYAAGYLGGYISILVPSGLGVSEGLVALMLGPYIGTERILATAISFRMIHTLIIWGNIVVSVALTSGTFKKINSTHDGGNQKNPTKR